MPLSKRNTTRQRLLDAAGRIFAAQGYRAATIRRICDRARANVAAVNYHFGGKEGLYEEVLSSIIRQAMDKYPPDLDQDRARTPEERLYFFIRSLLLRVLDPDWPAWCRRLLDRELAEPSPAFRSATTRNIRKARELLARILAELLGPRVPQETIDLCTASIAGQCLFYRHDAYAVPVFRRGVPKTPEGLDRIARHITEFSLGGLRRARRAK